MPPFINPASMQAAWQWVPSGGRCDTGLWLEINGRQHTLGQGQSKECGNRFCDFGCYGRGTNAI